MPKVFKSVEPGYLRNMRLLQKEYGPTPVSLKYDESDVETVVDEVKGIRKSNNVNCFTGKESGIKALNLDLEDVSEDEFDFDEEDTDKEGDNLGRKRAEVRCRAVVNIQQQIIVKVTRVPILPLMSQTRPTSSSSGNSIKSKKT